MEKLDEQQGLIRQLTEAVACIPAAYPVPQDGALLVQSWMPRLKTPEKMPSGTSRGPLVALETRGGPYTVLGRAAGSLATFQKAIAKYAFPLNPSSAGAHGRAFLSGQAAFCHDIKTLPAEVYPAAHEASLCGVGGVLLLPVHAADAHANPCAVLELVQSWSPVATETSLLAVRTCLEQAGLGPSAASPTKAWELVGPSSEVPAGSGERAEPAAHPSAQEPPEGESSESSSGDDGLPSTGAGRQRHGKGCKTHLTLQELEAQYPYSTKDAARNLGVSRTTLKRACRQHGIARWPHRSLLRLQKAMDATTALVNDAAQLLAPGKPGEA